MKKLFFLSLVTLLVLFSFQTLVSQGSSDPIQDFVKAMEKQGTEKIAALNDYVKKYPDPKSKWTQLAYFNLVTEYYQLKNYAEVIKSGEKRISLGSFGKGEEVRLCLVMAEAYGIKDSPVYDKAKALEYADKAVSLAGADDDADALAAAKNLKKQMATPAQPAITPIQKFKRHVANGEYPQAISVFKTLSADEQNDIENRRLYADCFFKSNKFDTALAEFKALYEKEKRAIFAYRIATIHSNRANAKANKDKTLFDVPVDYFLEAGLLYGKEGSTANRDTAFKKAKVDLSEKYDFNKKAKEYNEMKVGLEKESGKNESAIRQKKKDIRALNRKIRDYESDYGTDAPDSMYDQLDKMEEELKVLESGGTDYTKLETLDKEINELEARIDKELKSRQEEAKKRLNL